mmetsp:Transcript_146007/g.257424  ORF Transcript_146007/g.257424 Transcript_146007/m.257424 type:complete len:171 (-) Transcript_146007:175-687(-)
MDEKHANSMGWITALIPNEAIRVDRASVAHEGWVWKQSRHMKLWRKRWMILTIDRQLLTFEDENQRGGATDHFFMVDVPRPADDQGELPVEVEVEYPSKRKAALNLLSFGRFGDAESMRRVRLCFDAGRHENRTWVRSLQQVMCRPMLRPNEFRLPSTSDIFNMEATGTA